MIYIWGFVVFILSIAFISSTQIGKIASSIILVLIVGFFVIAARGFNKARDESDREKYNDKDKPYFNQKISSYRDDFSSSPRWLVWLGMLLVPIIYGLVFWLTG